MATNWEVFVERQWTFCLNYYGDKRWWRVSTSCHVWPIIALFLCDVMAWVRAIQCILFWFMVTQLDVFNPCMGRGMGNLFPLLPLMRNLPPMCDFYVCVSRGGLCDICTMGRALGVDWENFENGAGTFGHDLCNTVEWDVGDAIGMCAMRSRRWRCSWCERCGRDVGDAVEMWAMRSRCVRCCGLDVYDAVEMCCDVGA